MYLDRQSSWPALRGQLVPEWQKRPLELLLGKFWPEAVEQLV
jgi:hypothetical protein